MFRRTAAVAILVGVAAAGCSSGAGSEAPAADTVSSSTSLVTTTLAPTTTVATTTAPTTTTAPAREFEPLYADPSLSIEEQVEAAYLFHWEVLLEAYRTGTTEYLPLVYGEEMADLRSAEIGRLVSEGHHVEGDIDHDLRIVVVDSNHVSVVDGYTNRLVRVDSKSGVRIEEPSDEQVGYAFEMKRMDDQWLVTLVVRYHFSASSGLSS